MEYLRRTVDAELDELIPLAPAIAIEGAKGVGKSLTAERRADHHFFLDDVAQQALIEADPNLLGLSEGCILLDEWQRVPAVWDAVRRHVDRGAEPGRFLLAGSATPLAGVDAHSGAGRILTLRMRPLAFHERGLSTASVSLAALLNGTHGPISGETPSILSDYVAAIVSSGFPGIHASPPRLRSAQLDAYIARIIDRDMPEQGLAVRRPETLLRWLRAYAAASSSTTSYSRILDATTAGDGTQPAKTTTIVHRDLLTQLWILDPVPGWSHSRNPLKRLQQAPKHQLVDPGLAARLLNLSEASLQSPTGAAMTGPLFESLATLSVRVAAQAANASVGHLRTGNGDREVDLVVEGPDGHVVGIEVKLAASVTDADVRHLLWLREQRPEEVVDLVVVTTGRHAYRRQDGVAVVPLALLGA